MQVPGLARQNATDKPRQHKRHHEALLDPRSCSIKYINGALEALNEFVNLSCGVVYVQAGSA